MKSTNMKDVASIFISLMLFSDSINKITNYGDESHRVNHKITNLETFLHNRSLLPFSFSWVTDNGALIVLLYGLIEFMSTFGFLFYTDD